MGFLTLPVAITIVGSVASICLTVYKLMSSKKGDSEISKHCAVQCEKIAELQRNDERIQAYLDKLNDMIFKLLSED